MMMMMMMMMLLPVSAAASLPHGRGSGYSEEDIEWLSNILDQRDSEGDGPSIDS